MSAPFRRRQLIELHEQPWFPEAWRHLFCTGLGRAFVMFGMSREISLALAPFVARQRPAEVLDLCSGSGECSVDAWAHIPEDEARRRCTLVLSDLYPDPAAWTRLGPSTRFVDAPVDALALGDDLPRTRIMLNSLHHFTPRELSALLRSTASTADGFLAVDRSARNWREMLITVLVVPAASALITAFALRPLRVSNLLWGLLIPVIPLVALFDGVVSNLRSYTVEELRQLVEGIPGPLTWEIGQTPGGKGSPPMIYIMGTRPRAEEP